MPKCDWTRIYQQSFRGRIIWSLYGEHDIEMWKHIIKVYKNIKYQYYIQYDCCTVVAPECHIFWNFNKMESVIKKWSTKQPARECFCKRRSISVSQHRFIGTICRSDCHPAGHVNSAINRHQSWHLISPLKLICAAAFFLNSFRKKRVFLKKNYAQVSSNHVSLLCIS